MTIFNCSICQKKLIKKESFACDGVVAYLNRIEEGNEIICDAVLCSECKKHTGFYCSSNGCDSFDLCPVCYEKKTQFLVVTNDKELAIKSHMDELRKYSENFIGKVLPFKRSDNTYG